MAQLAVTAPDTFANDLASLVRPGGAPLKDVIDAAVSIIRRIQRNEVSTGTALELVEALLVGVRSRLDDEGIEVNCIRVPYGKFCGQWERARQAHASAVRYGQAGGSGRLVAGSSAASPAPPASERVSIITAADAEFTAEKDARGRKGMICSRQTWIDQALREKSLPLLTEAEKLHVRTD